MADVDARYGDKTPLDWELLSRLSDLPGLDWMVIGQAVRWSANIIFCKRDDSWFWGTMKGNNRIPTPRTLGDLYRLADALGVKLREET